VLAYYGKKLVDWGKLWWSNVSTQDPEIPQQKTFKPKFPGKPVQASNHGRSEEEWWKMILSNYTCPGKSLVRAKELTRLWHTLGCSNRENLQRVNQRLLHGKDIECQGEYRKLLQAHIPTVPISMDGRSRMRSQHVTQERVTSTRWY